MRSGTHWIVSSQASGIWEHSVQLGCCSFWNLVFCFCVRAERVFKSTTVDPSDCTSAHLTFGPIFSTSCEVTKSGLSSGLLVDWLEHLDPEVTSVCPDRQQKLLFALNKVRSRTAPPFRRDLAFTWLMTPPGELFPASGPRKPGLQTVPFSPAHAPVKLVLPAAVHQHHSQQAQRLQVLAFIPLSVIPCSHTQLV